MTVASDANVPECKGTEDYRTTTEPRQGDCESRPCILHKLVAFFIILVISAVLLLMGYFYMQLIPFGEPILLAMDTGPEGTEILITKAFRGDPTEPYWVDFWYRPQSSPVWHWHYLHHQARPWQWENTRICFDREGFADVYRQEDLIASLNLRSHSFWLSYGERSREIDATGRITHKYPLLFSPREWQR